MKIGMLWFDDDPKTDLETKLEKAFEYYKAKYNKAPTLVWVHPSMLALPEGEEYYTSPLGLSVVPNRSVVFNHFWIGFKDTTQRKES